MRRRYAKTVHPRGLLRSLLDWARGRDQRLLRGGPGQPLLLMSYPSGQEDVARELEAAYLHTLPGLLDGIAAPYRPMLAALPPLVVVLLRPSNVCGCLGHHHLAGLESGLARRLAADLGEAVGEIDLAYENIRRWQPQPISSLAAAGAGDSLPRLHFHAALLTVLLHELEHLAFADHPERQVRRASDSFYAALMRELLRSERGIAYGMEDC